VLVTGASGFLGTYVVQELLKRGYQVRAVVRDTAKGEYVQSKFPGAKYVIVKEMNEPGAYDEAVKGVDAVVHVASPLDVGNTGHPDEVIEPAVVGVENLLKAVSTASLGGNVKRFVQISSIAAIAGLPDGNPKTLTEEVWNDADVDKCYELGAPAPGPLKYIASKTKAERAFWKWFEEKRDFDGVAILPGMVRGG
jgi:nucleoside-diphosphate-sugar epimerase